MVIVKGSHQYGVAVKQYLLFSLGSNSTILNINFRRGKSLVSHRALLVTIKNLPHCSLWLLC